MKVRVKRIYDEASPDDGYRILVDRLWPRGISKEKAHLDEWMKGIAPSDPLRTAFHHGGEDFSAFKKAYLRELADSTEKQELLKAIAERAKNGNVTLLFGAKDEANNQAVLLKELLEKKYL